MATFGWQGETCIDEWTMAACNLAMGATLLLGGSGAYSIDNILIRLNPALAGNAGFAAPPEACRYRSANPSDRGK